MNAMGVYGCDSVCVCVCVCVCDYNFRQLMLQVIVRPGELVYLCKEMFHSTWLYDVGHILYGGVHSSVCV